MHTLMADYEKKVREVLRENGCYFLRHGKSDHDVWVNPENGDRQRWMGK